MDHIQGLSRKQMTIFPQSLDDYISQENPYGLSTPMSVLSIWVVWDLGMLFSKKQVAHRTTLAICSNSISMAISTVCDPVDN